MYHFFKGDKVHNYPEIPGFSARCTACTAFIRLTRLRDTASFIPPLGVWFRVCLGHP